MTRLVYLLIGLIFMVLTLTVFYEIPQLNIGSVFLLKSDEYLTNASGYDSEKARQGINSYLYNCIHFQNIITCPSRDCSHLS